MKIHEAVEKSDCRKIFKQLVNERDHAPTSVEFLIKAEDPARELLRYGVYQLGTDNYNECIEEIANNQFTFKALLTYFRAIDSTIFMSIKIDEYDSTHGFVRDNVNPAFSNYIRVSDLPDSPITDIFLDVLESNGWWTPDGYYYFGKEFSKRLVSRLELS